jgi:hypothetical protein
MNKHLLQSEAPLWARSAARIATRDVASILDLPVPRVRWVECDENEIRAGWVDSDKPNTIFLSLGWARRNGPRQVRGLIYHEARHLWQRKHSRYTTRYDRLAAENDANSFVRQQLSMTPNLTMWYETDDYY